MGEGYVARIIVANHVERGGRSSRLAESIQHLTEAREHGIASHAGAALEHLLKVKL